MHCDYVVMSETSFRVVFSKNHNNTDNVFRCKSSFQWGKGKGEGEQEANVFSARYLSVVQQGTEVICSFSPLLALLKMNSMKSSLALAANGMRCS